MKSVIFRTHAYGAFHGARRVGPAEWPFFDLLFLHDGRIEVEFARRTKVEISAPGAVLIFPGTFFQGRALGRSAMASVQHFELIGPFAPGVLEETRGKRAGFELFRPIGDPDIERYVRKALRLAEERGEDWETRTALLTLQLAELRADRDALARRGDGPPERFRRLTAWLETNLARDIDVADMAKRVNMSESHFRAAFKRAMGDGPAGWLRGVRTKEAARLLSSTATPIKEIARAVGYPDIAHFYRAFAARYGDTPRRFRDRAMAQALG